MKEDDIFNFLTFNAVFLGNDHNSVVIWQYSIYIFFLDRASPRHGLKSRGMEVISPVLLQPT